MGLPRRAALRAFVFALCVAFTASVPVSAQEKPSLLVFAAASLKNALDEIAAGWSRESGKAVDDLLCRELGARQADRGRARRPTSSSRPTSTGWTTCREAEPDRAGHAPQPARQRARADRAEGSRRRRSRSRRASTLPALLGDGRLAMANVDAVPAGKYGKAALEKLGRLGRRSTASVAQAENVRAALALVSRGEAPLGIVYRDRRRRRAEREDRRHVPRGHPSADHLSGRALTAGDATPAADAFLRATSRSGKRAAIVRGAGLHGAGDRRGHR